jgi:DNA helicase-2/ATP-dependent DNA helicase PcrA
MDTKRLLTVSELMVVGDDYQAIHEWRGATVRNILEFTHQFPTSETVCLSLNYRSVPSVLEAARNVIANNANQRHKELIATREEPSDSVEVTEFESPQDEANKIAGQIFAACKEGASPSHFAILYRSNAHSQPLEQALRTRGIPYRLRGGARSFFERAEIKDTMAYARLLLNPRSDLDFERAIHVPHRGVGEVTIEHLRERIELDVSRTECTCLMEAAKAETRSATCPKNRREALTAFTTLFDRGDDLPGSSLRELLDAAGYLSMIKEAYPTNGNSGPKDRYENVIALLNLAEQDPDRPLRDFIDACSTLDSSVSLEEEDSEEDEERENKDTNCVSLMTMHASKGLEFKIVYVAGFAEGSLPHSLSVVEGKIEEERRLCYVAITRARDRLVLCIPTTRMRFGKKEETRASRFLVETGLTLPDRVLAQT